MRREGSGMPYIVNVGLDYAGKRAEAGDVIDDLPSKSASWLVEQGIVSPLEAKSEPKSPKKEAE